MTSGAIRTDFILSAEIMVIALNEVADQAFVPRLIILIVVALVITAAVYGVVALIVKMDDIGLSLAQRSSRAAQKVGLGLVAAMPKVLATLSAVGTVAMLWVGGHILLVGTDTLGWHVPYAFVHHLEEDAHHAVASIGALLAWLVNTGISAVIGLVIGSLVVAIVHVLPFGKKKSHAS
jgi:predicted DNA repair protein MutK